MVARLQVVTPLGLSSEVVGHGVQKAGAQPFPESEGCFSRERIHAASPVQRVRKCRVQALILSPTRELAAQTTKTILAVGDFAKVSAHTCIGGTSLGAHTPYPLPPTLRLCPAGSFNLLLLQNRQW